jgi:hypothetical protein
MLLTIAFACFAVQIAAWMLLPSSARFTESREEAEAVSDAAETAAA